MAKEKVKATFTVDKDIWRKFRVKVTAADKKYSQILEELIRKYIER